MQPISCNSNNAQSKIDEFFNTNPAQAFIAIKMSPVGSKTESIHINLTARSIIDQSTYTYTSTYVVNTNSNNSTIGSQEKYLDINGIKNLISSQIHYNVIGRSTNATSAEIKIEQSDYDVPKID